MNAQSRAFIFFKYRRGITMSKTLGQLAQQFAYLNVPIGAKGSKLEYIELTRTEVLELVPEEKYQRLISASSLKKQGQMNWSLLLPMVIAIRPDSVPESERGSRVIDGQHKGIKYLQSGVEDPYMCAVSRHPEGYTLQQCEEAEAQIFTELNTFRKKLTKLEEIRAGVVWKVPEALWVQQVLMSLDLVVDGTFGAVREEEEEDKKNPPMELKGFYQFWFMTVDYTSGDFDKIQRGYHLWKKVYPEEKYVNGTALRAMVLVQEFIDTLTNGRKKAFHEYVTKKLGENISQDGLVRPYSDRKSNRYVLYYILEKYAEYAAANPKKHPAAYRIGEQTIDDAKKISTKFSDPRLPKSKV